MVDRSDWRSLVEFSPDLLANLVPVVGIVWLGWKLGTLVLFYWVDVVALTVVYAGCALFAQRKIVTDGRRVRLPGVSDDVDYGEAWSDDPRTVDLHPRLPPVYPRNLPVVRASLLWALGAAGIVGYNLATDTLGLGPPVTGRSPVLLGASLVGVVVSHTVHASRNFIAPRRYEDMSAHMVLEIPLRVVGYLVGSVWAWIMATGLVAGLLAVAGADRLAETAVVVLLFGGWFAIKLSVEWGRFRAERADDPGRFASWFVPEDPRRDRAE